MASIFGHALVGATLSQSISPGKGLKWSVIAALSALAPDADVITFSFGIPYESIWGHRGFSHSVLFAIIWALILMVIFKPKRKMILGIVVFLSVISHGILDAMTNGGLGVGFFTPFDSTRYFLPWRPIQVSPIGASAFFSQWGLRVISSELLWIGFPCGVIWIASKLSIRK